MVAVLRFFACIAFCVALPILPRHQTLNFSSGTVSFAAATVERSYHPTYLNFG
jgi:hypothetical protein